MESNKEGGSGLSFWLPGGAVLVSLAISTFVLQRQPFVDARPASPPVVTQPPIDARLWQDPFDALIRYRELIKDTKTDVSGTSGGEPCTPTVVLPPDIASEIAPARPATAGPPNVMVALVRGAGYADEVELRRRIRYAILAGFKTSRRVPLDEGHIRCLSHNVGGTSAEIPYEAFGPDPYDPPLTIDEVPDAAARTVVFWLKEDALGDRPLANLEQLRIELNFKVFLAWKGHLALTLNDADGTLKVIGPASSALLRKMYHEEAAIRSTQGQTVPQEVEIYSPLATAERRRLMDGLDEPTPQAKLDHPAVMKLLRTVSDDGTMASLLLEELKLRHVDPALALQCGETPAVAAGLNCPGGRWEKSNRVAIVTEWDSFYSRALMESFKNQLAMRAGLLPKDDPSPNPPIALSTLGRQEIDQWVLRFGYFRGVDGRLPEKATKSPKTSSADKSAPATMAQETADGNGQLDYMRRLADHIAKLDKAQRDAGGEGIGAIGIFGQDTYDKLLALQALKSRLPTKVYFSTDLDARMLQQGQAKITRNLVLAAPYGLTLTRALQQDVPPFRESLQSAVYIAVMAALAPQEFEAKREKFDYSKSSLLSPGIYEIGASGFIPLTSTLDRRRPASCSVGSLADKGGRVRPQDIMALQCLQDPSPPAYVEVSPRIRDWLGQAQSFFFAGPLSVLLVAVGGVLAWWRAGHDRGNTREKRAGWAQRAPLVLYSAAVFFAWLATRYWQVELLWLAGAIALVGGWCQGRNRQQVKAALGNGGRKHLGDGGAGWYVVIPATLFALALLWGYQNRAWLTGEGLGEPMFLFEGISAWPTVVLRLLAAAISVASLAWAWRKLSQNRQEIERLYDLEPDLERLTLTFSQLWRRFRAPRPSSPRPESVLAGIGRFLHRTFFPLADSQMIKLASRRIPRMHLKSAAAEGQATRSLLRLWIEHRLAGSMPSRMIRVLLLTWVFLVLTSALYVIVPVEDNPIRGDSSGVWLWSWGVSTVTFQILVFWVMDANLLLSDSSGN